MIKPLALLLLLVVGLTQASATMATPVGRDSKPSREKIQREKRAFLIKELELSDYEADALMNVLSELDDARYRLWSETAQMHRRLHKKEASISEEELIKHFDRSLDNRVKEAELERTYYSKCKSIIPMHKLVRLEHANRRFFREHFAKHKKKD